MEIKTTTTKFRFRIESKPGGGFIARPEEGMSEILEGATREEVQQKIDDKLTAMVGQVLNNGKVGEIVGELLHNQKKIGGVNVQVKVTSKSSADVPSQPAIPSAANLGIARSSDPQFESSNKLWLVIALVAIAAVLMYLLKR